MTAQTLAKMDDRELGEYMGNHRRRIAAMNRLMEDLNRPAVSYAAWLGQQLAEGHDDAARDEHLERIKDAAQPADDSAEARRREAWDRDNEGERFEPL
jgi:hypothetical protein